MVACFAAIHQLTSTGSKGHAQKVAMDLFGDTAGTVHVSESLVMRSTPSLSVPMLVSLTVSLTAPTGLFLVAVIIAISTSSGGVAAQ